MKRLIALILAVLLVFSLTACGKGGKKKQTTETTAETKAAATEDLKSFTLIVVHADGSEKTFNIESAEEFIDAALIEEGVVELVDDGSGMKVTVADGEALEEGAAWIAYEGEYYVEQSLDCTRIMEGTVYKLVYTVF